MRSTADLPEIWWESKTATERFELMRKFGVKKHSKKAVRKMYDIIFNNIIK